MDLHEGGVCDDDDDGRARVECTDGATRRLAAAALPTRDEEQEGSGQAHRGGGGPKLKEDEKWVKNLSNGDFTYCTELTVKPHEGDLTLAATKRRRTTRRRCSRACRRISRRWRVCSRRARRKHRHDDPRVGPGASLSRRDGRPSSPDWITGVPFGVGIRSVMSLRPARIPRLDENAACCLPGQ